MKIYPTLPPPTEVLTEVKRLAVADPDHTSLCRYVNNKTMEPECIVGHALINLGVPKTDLCYGLEDPNTTGIGRMYGLTAEQKEGKSAAARLDRIQTWQDCGKTWGEAVALLDTVSG